MSKGLACLYWVMNYTATMTIVCFYMQKRSPLSIQGLVSVSDSCNLQHSEQGSVGFVMLETTD